MANGIARTWMPMVNSLEASEVATAYLILWDLRTVGIPPGIGGSKSL